MPADDQTAPAAPVAEPVVVAPSAHPKTDAIVDLWFAECVQGTAVGRYTDAYNALYSALPELKARLSKEN